MTHEEGDLVSDGMYSNIFCGRGTCTDIFLNNTSWKKPPKGTNISWVQSSWKSMYGSFVVEDLLIAWIILLIVCSPFHLDFFQWWCILGLLKDEFANKPSSVTWLRNVNSPSYIYTSHLSEMITVYMHQSHVPLVSMLVYLNAWKLSYLIKTSGNFLF